MPAARSGIAASTINTSRQIGAVAGVAVLGSMVNAPPTSDLRERPGPPGIPARFQDIVHNAIKQGSVSGGGSGNGSSATATYGSVVGQVFSAAYDAFRA